jgi:hypothetical protein
MTTRKILVHAAFLFVIPLAIGCGSTDVASAPSQARLMGREADVRIDARLSTVDIGPGEKIAIHYEIENLRTAPIAIADLIPELTFDLETGVITIVVGAEVPGNEFLPRLDVLRSGERKSFSRGVNMNVGRPTVRVAPHSLRIRLVYLNDIGPFDTLVEMDEKAVHDPSLADALFLPWVDSVRFVLTNQVPVHWKRPGLRSAAEDAGSTRPRRPRPPRSPF